MNLEEARKLLDAANAGVDVSVGGITEALVATGDLSPCRVARRQQMVEAMREWPYYAQSSIAAEAA